MKLKQLLTANAILFVAGGIAFALYGPLMMAFFAVPEILDSTVLVYWEVASFVRLFGAALFGLGILLWAVQPALKTAAPEVQRSVMVGMILANGMAAFVSLTQQAAIWQTPAGWITSGVFTLLALAYIFTLVSNSRAPQG